MARADNRFVLAIELVLEGLNTIRKALKNAPFKPLQLSQISKKSIEKQKSCDPFSKASPKSGKIRQKQDFSIFCLFSRCYKIIISGNFFNFRRCISTYFFTRNSFLTLFLQLDRCILAIFSD